jgi:hypothetical protein
MFRCYARAARYSRRLDIPRPIKWQCFPKSMELYYEANPKRVLHAANFRFGSGADENPVPRLRLLLGVEQTFSEEMQTSNF